MSAAACHLPLPSTCHLPRLARPELSRNPRQPPERLQCTLQAQRGHCCSGGRGPGLPLCPSPAAWASAAAGVSLGAAQPSLALLSLCPCEKQPINHIRPELRRL